ncbi:MAG TPA: purine-nucleoside phosphorylase [Actinomycetota bacterium]
MTSAGLPGPGDDLAEQGAALVRTRTALEPSVALILGSGLGPALGEALVPEATFAFTDLPGFPPPGVPGHAGTLTLGRLAGVPVATYSGRVHFYEGYGMDAPALLPRLAHALGARTLVVTAAAGGLHPDLPAGTVVVLTDHLNLMGAAPLRGWRYPDGMPAFVGMRDAYDADLASLALERGRALGLRIEAGVYAAMAGPAFETPTELRLLALAGATVVGMSTVPEVMPARALEMRVLGLTMVTNALGEHVEHDEVVRVGNETAPAVGRFLVDLLPHIAGGGS